MSEVRKPKGGAVRWKDAIDHDHHVVEPGHESYLQALEAAEEYWDATLDEWRPFVPVDIRAQQNA